MASFPRCRTSNARTESSGGRAGRHAERPLRRALGRTTAGGAGGPGGDDPAGVHLPRLADSDLLEYDPERNEVVDVSEVAGALVTDEPL
ncbi:hypothetical protein BRC81_15360 [Halobacteriales archaeon QS_1_68_20]|nr:MAG: hypothetical protein BRC81_15360 [Halobacteriales archaeon QS_1_68_20]